MMSHAHGRWGWGWLVTLVWVCFEHVPCTKATGQLVEKFGKVETMASSLLAMASNNLPSDPTY